MTIYYTFNKETGEYSGSGTPLIDNETHGSTTVAVPDYDEDDNLPIWDGTKWN